MPRSVTVSVVCANALEFSADVLVLKYADGLHGADLATYDQLKRSGTTIDLPATGAWSVTKADGALGVDHVVFIGVGPLYEFEYSQIRHFGRTAIAAVGELLPNARHVALTLHGPGYGLDEIEAFDAEVAGLVDGIQRDFQGPRLMRITIVEIERRRAERLASRLRTLLPIGSIDVVSANDAGQPTLAPTEEIRNAGYVSDNKPRIFVAMPFKSEMDDVYDYGILQPANQRGYLCERADRVPFTDDVVHWIKERIRSADLVIAEVTDANPNVYLEVGFAWGIGRPTMLIARSAEELKFDLKTQRCFVYKSIKDLERQVTAMLAESQRSR